MGIRWASEGCDRYYDPSSGALVTSMTSSAQTSINIYCEQPYSSPDGRRIAILRYDDISFSGEAKLLVGDLKRLYISLVDTEAIGVFNAAWSGLLHYFKKDGRLMRLSLETLEQQVVPVEVGHELRGRAGSISPDQRYVACVKTLPDTMALELIDLETGRSDVIFDHPEMTNPHAQFNPVTGKEILVQINRGSRRARDGTVERWGDEQGTTHMLIDRQTGKARPLPVGPPYTASSTGHSNIIANTGRVLVSTSWNLGDWSLDARTPQGNLVTVAPGKSAPRVFKAPEHRFNHVNASRCGRYFVADSLPGSLFDERGVLRSWCIVVGNLQSGKYRTLVTNSMCSGGGGQHTHPHPYLTADNRNVIFNCDYFHCPTQVLAARVPEGFLESLD